MFELLLSTLFVLFSLTIGVTSSPVHSVLWLVATFAVAAVALLSAGVEFLALRFRVVYMGAIAVLFLFVVMMLDLKPVERNEGEVGSYLIMIPLFAPLLYASYVRFGVHDFKWATDPLVSLTEVSSIELMGQLLYTQLWEFYLIAGFVLLVALIGAVVLTVPRPYSLISDKEDLSRQLARDPSDAIFTVKKA